MLKSIDESLPVSTARATRGKYLRAEPVAAL
jgi:phage terminase large subunit-like protein